MSSGEELTAARPSGDLLRQALEGDDGFVLLPGLVDEGLVMPALRRLNLEILRCGITAEQIEEWKYATYWPSIRGEPEFLALRDRLERLFEPKPGEVWGDAQLLLRFPDEAEEWPLTPHVDELPTWAEGRTYQAIVGVALSRSSAGDGCLAVWRGSHRNGSDGTAPELVELDAGDVVVMHPKLLHSSTLNRGGAIRYAAYFRLLGPAA